jgi:hypothetical protein
LSFHRQITKTLGRQGAKQAYIKYNAALRRNLREGAISSCERSLLHDGAANMASAAGAAAPVRFVADCG